MVRILSTEYLLSKKQKKGEYKWLKNKLFINYSYLTKVTLPFVCRCQVYIREKYISNIRLLIQSLTIVLIVHL